jgi:hypothetical protein
MSKWHDYDDKVNRRMRKLVEKKRKDKLIDGRYNEDGEADEAINLGSDYPCNWEESFNPEVQTAQEETIKEEREEIND